MRNMIIKDPSRITLDAAGKLTPESRKLVSRDIVDFMHEAISCPRSVLNQRIQEWTSKADMPVATGFYPIMQRFLEASNYDEGWRRIFKVMDFTGVPVSGFRSFVLQNNVTPEMVPSGGRARVWNVAGSTDFVLFDKHGAALELDKILLADQEWVQLQDIIISFRNEFAAYLASAHYAAIEASGADLVAWQNPDPAALPNTAETYTANRDAETINAAAIEILLACQNKGYGVTTASELILLAPLQLRARARKALNLLLQSTTASTTNVDFNISLLSTMQLAATNQMWLILPERQLQSGIRLEDELLQDQDILAFSDIWANWMRFGIAVGDTDQIRRLATA